MNNNIGDFIKVLRLNKNLTQKELGNLLDIDDKTISKWERGVYLPDITMLSPLSKALDITVDELLECKLHETSTDSQNDLIVENENNTTETKPTKSNKGKLIFKFILLIIIISFSISTLCFTKIKKYNNNQEQIAQETSVNVYKITSNDKNLIIEGYIIEDDYKYLTIIKRVSIKKEIINKEDFDNYKISLSLSFDDERSFIFKHIDSTNISDEGNTYDILNIESQKISSNVNVKKENIKLSLLYLDNKNDFIKAIDFNILMSKEL